MLQLNACPVENKEVDEKMTNINWKEFFRPRWYKIIITFALFIILTMLMPHGCLGGALCPEGMTNYNYIYSCKFSCLPDSEAAYRNFTKDTAIPIGELIGIYLILCTVFMKKSINNESRT